jgi:hypothetical protein
VTKDNDIAKKPLWKRVWKSALGMITVFGVLWGVLEGVYFFTEVWHDYKILKENVNGEDFEDRITTLETYVEKKTKSFHVGFRVFKVMDEDTGIMTRVKRYRDWDGKWHEIFKDIEASLMYGVDYYYYINQKTDEKIYCW